MPSAKHPSAKPAATIANATAKTRSVIENLQARLTGDTRGRNPPPADETLEDLEKQLQEYFERTTSSSTRPAMLDELRSQVIEGVVDRILAEWSNPQSVKPGSGLGREVMDRLIERVLEEFRNHVGQDGILRAG